LKHKKRSNPVSDWIVRPNAFTALIDPRQFDQAQERLYWLLPSHYKRGIYLLRKIKKEIYSDIESVLKKHGFDPEYARLTPLTLAIKRYLPDGTAYWCFLISPKIEDRKELLCVGIDMEADDLIDRIFLIPSDSFNLCGMCLLTEQDQKYAEWLQKEEDLESVIISLLRATVSV